MVRWRTLVPRAASMRPVRWNCGVQGRSAGDVGSSRLRRLAERSQPRPPAAPTAATCGPSPSGWAAAASPSRRAWTACTCAVTWPRWAPAAWPGPRWPARRRRCAATSPGRSGRVASPPTRPAACGPPRAVGRLPRVLSGGEIGALLDVPVASAVDQRDLAVLELLYAAGLRVSELCGLDRRGVDLPGRTVTVLGKGGKERRVPIHAVCAEALGAWLDRGPAPHGDARSPPEAVFVNRRGGRLGPRDVRRMLDPGPPRPPTPTPCATPSPPTCSTAGPICGSSKSCSATPAWARRRSTRT